MWIEPGVNGIRLYRNGERVSGIIRIAIECEGPGHPVKLYTEQYVRLEEPHAQEPVEEDTHGDF